MRLWFKFLREQRAVVAMTTAVVMPALLLFVALGVEVGEWYAVDRHMQTVADAAAVAAAIELANGGTLANATTKAGWSAAVNEANGFGGTPTVSCLSSISPDVIGSCASTWSTGYVSAIITASQPTIFAYAFASSVTVGAKAVASWTQPYQACGLALAPSGTAISTSGGPTITLGTNCVLASDSTGTDSLDVSAATAVTAQTMISAGGLNVTCVGRGCTSPAITVVTGAVVDGPVTPDPFSCTLTANASLCSTATAEGFSAVETAIPSPCTSMVISSGVVSNAGSVCYTSMELGASFTGCIGANSTCNTSGTTLTVTSVAAGSVQVGEQITGAGISSPTYITAYTGTGSPGGPGPYTVSASQTVASESMGTQLQLSSGTYYDEGSFDVPSGATATEASGATGVTIILANPSACEGNATFEGTATLTAPNSGTYSGMLLIQVEATGVTCSPLPSDSIAASASVTLAGNVYTPGAAWTINAAPATTCLNGVACGGVANECMTITANTIAFDGSVSLEGAGCTAPAGTDVYNVQTISVVE